MADPRVCSAFPENFFSWVQPSDKFGEGSVRCILSRLSGLPRSQQMIRSELEYRPFWLISRKLIEAFCRMVLKEFDRANEILDETEKNMMTPAVLEGLITLEHAQGYRHLLQGLVAYNHSLQLDDGGQLFLELLLELHQRRNLKLSRGAFVVIRGAQANFEMYLDRDLKSRISILDKLSRDSPDLKNSEWKLNAYGARKSMRNKANWADLPSDDETRIIRDCVRMNPNHVMVRLAVSMYVGDQVSRTKHGGWAPGKGELKVGDALTFNTKQDILNYVTPTARELLEKLPCPKVLQDLSELLTNRLSKILDNVELGKECLLRTIDIHPESSKANHRLAIFFYTHELKFEEAAMYARRAYELNRVNFPALMDTIKLLMRDPLGHREEIEVLFNGFDSAAHKTLTRQNLASLFVLRAIFYFAVVAPEDCIKLLFRAYKLDQSSLGNLELIPLMTQRYCWDWTKKYRESMQICLLHFIQTHQPEADLGECLKLAAAHLTSKSRRETMELGNGGGTSGRGRDRPRRAVLPSDSSGRDSAADVDGNWRAGSGSSCVGTSARLSRGFGGRDVSASSLNGSRAGRFQSGSERQTLQGSWRQ